MKSDFCCQVKLRLCSSTGNATVTWPGNKTPHSKHVNYWETLIPVDFNCDSSPGALFNAFTGKSQITQSYFRRLLWSFVPIEREGNVWLKVILFHTKSILLCSLRPCGNFYLIEKRYTVGQSAQNPWKAVIQFCGEWRHLFFALTFFPLCTWSCDRLMLLIPLDRRGDLHFYNDCVNSSSCGSLWWSSIWQSTMTSIKTVKSFDGSSAQTGNTTWNIHAVDTFLFHTGCVGAKSELHLQL